MKLESLKKKYPCFIYEKCSYAFKGKTLEISFVFRLEPGIVFKPKLSIEGLVKRKDLDNLVFNLGMIEAVSYWKATCSPKMLVKAGFLDKEQIRWWQDLILKGMGQFFYENRIRFQKPLIIASGPKLKANLSFRLKNRVLVPIGGGKDSLVTMELLKKAKKNILCFSLNPTPSALKGMEGQESIIARRKIDPKLLELNRKGFLNGHTPFSAYLAFLSLLVSSASGCRYIAFSNERSSNEGNASYLGKTINHQWSKSFEFEEKFRRYSKKYLDNKAEYFSLLRPLYEIQIAGLFSRFPEKLDSFLSCNEAFKTDSGRKEPSGKWCCKCSKCLFAFSILYPFVNEKKLVAAFGENLFKSIELLPLAKELIGEKGIKPLECVGTYRESLIAFFLSWKKARISGKVPVLLKSLESRFLKDYNSLEKEFKKMLFSWNPKNNLPKGFEKILA
jgi:hypothetical protein